MPSGLHPAAKGQTRESGNLRENFHSYSRKKKKLEKDCSMESHKFPTSYQKSSNTHIPISASSQQDQKNTTVKLSWLCSLHKKPVGWFRNIQSDDTSFSMENWIPMNCITGFHRSQQGQVKLGSLSHHPSVVTPCWSIFPPPNRDLLSGTWPSMFGVQARWAWRTQIPRISIHITQSMDQWCTLPETDIAPGILVSFWDRHKFRGLC